MEKKREKNIFLNIIILRKMEKKCGMGKSMYKCGTLNQIKGNCAAHMARTVRTTDITIS